ncbi:hypothetical protein [Clostridium sp.]
MKIGKFTKQNNITIDAVRYYIGLVSLPHIKRMNIIGTFIVTRKLNFLVKLKNWKGLEIN